MRFAHLLVVPLGLVLTAVPGLALGAGTSSPLPSPHSMGVQQLHVGPGAACHPASGTGDVVVIPGIAPFDAESVSFSQLPSANAVEQTERHVGRGNVSVVRKIGASSAQIRVGERATSAIPSMTITMRKGGMNAYMVVTLEMASLSNESFREVNGTPLETLVFTFESMSVCYAR